MDRVIFRMIVSTFLALQTFTGLLKKLYRRQISVDERTGGVPDCDMLAAFWGERRQECRRHVMNRGQYEDSDDSRDGGCLLRDSFICAAASGRTIHTGPSRGRTYNLPD